MAVIPKTFFYESAWETEINSRSVYSYCWLGPTTSEHTVPEYAKKRVLILGVGNVLFGDDGFGPSAVEYMLKNCDIPEDVYVMDVGIGSGDILFNVALSQTRPQRMVILDAVDLKKKPGEVFKLSIDELPASKLADFSMHFFPSANLLKELRDHVGINIIIVACQAERMPDFVSIGLSDSVKQSLPKAAELALKLAGNASPREKTD